MSGSSREDADCGEFSLKFRVDPNFGQACIADRQSEELPKGLVRHVAYRAEIQ